MSNKIVFKRVLAWLAIMSLIGGVYATQKSTGDLLEEGGTNSAGKYLLVDVVYRIIFIYGFIMSTWMYQGAQSFTDHFGEMILANPSVNPSSESYNVNMANLMLYSIRILTPFYVMAIVATAFYLIFMAGSPNGKANAKGLLKRLLISLLFFSLSPLILETMFSVSHYLAEAILNSTDTDSAKLILREGLWGSFWIMAKIGMTDIELSIPFWLSTFVMAWMPYLIMCLRYIMVVMFAIVFPIGIVLYSFVFFRGIGRKILEQTMLWIFMQVFFAVAIMVIAASASFYDLMPEKPTRLAAVNVIPLPGAEHVLSWVQNTMDITWSTTDVISWTMGVTGHAILFVVPFMMLRLLNNFLP